MTALADPQVRSHRATDSLSAFVRGRHARTRRWWLVVGALVVVLIALAATSLMIGQTFYSPVEVLRVIAGDQVPGASFTVGELRLPRTVLGLGAGLAFGLGGVTFQTMLRNPLASPDVIGISSGASAAAAVGIIIVGLEGAAVSTAAIVVGLLVALTIYGLSHRGRVVGTRLILIGIAVAALLDSVTAYALSTAPSWELQEALRWLTGSLNNSSWSDATLVWGAVVVLGAVLLGVAGRLTLLQLGDDTAQALGVRTETTRVIAIIAAVGLVATATAATGPIAFVAFLAGPIAARVIGPSQTLLVPAALMGGLLVLASDLIGQYALGVRYPVGVVTGALGAPYLIYLIIRRNRAGGVM